MITAVITCLNEHTECMSTVRSLRETAGDIPIIVVDDASQTRVEFSDPGIKVVRNDRRCGVGPSRHIGIANAKTPWTLVIDAHMRFEPGWLDRALTQIGDAQKTLWCGSCVAIDDRRDLFTSRERYYGATWNFNGPDRHNPSKRQVFEVVWGWEVEDGAEIPALMGACYFVPREWYMLHGGLQHLRSWGGDEQLLSLKAWLTGDGVRLAKNVRIGHKFWSQKGRPFRVETGHVWYNKLFLMFSLLPPNVSRYLMGRLPQGTDKSRGMANFFEDWHLVCAEYERNKALFRRDFDWYLKRFALSV